MRLHAHECACSEGTGPALSDSPGDGRRSTIHDVAKAAGVSIKTVSRVARNEPRVSEPTRKKVLAAIEKLNYRPIVAARSTVGARSRILGLIVDNPNPTYVGDLLRGALNQARREGYHVLVEPPTAREPLASQIMGLVRQANLDGMVLPPPISDDPDVLDALERADVAIARVAPSTRLELGVCVAMDDLAASRLLTEHLLEMGHTDIGFVTGSAGEPTTLLRLDGFRQALANAGVSVREEWIAPGAFTYKSGMEAGERLLTGPDRPTAIFASNDDMAAGVMSVAHKHGLAIPADVSVVGFDDSAFAKVVWPQLTTVRQPVEEMAASAVAMLVERLREDDAEPAPMKTLEFAIVQRESAGPPPKP